MLAGGADPPEQVRDQLRVDVADPAAAGLPGLTVDTDLRWRVITALAAAGRIDADGPASPTIDAELQGDPTAAGKRQAATAATARPIADAHATVQTLLCLSADSRDHVDSILEAGAAAGGTPDPNPQQDYGFMYGRSLEDPDGHIWEIMWMDPAAVRQEIA